MAIPLTPENAQQFVGAIVLVNDRRTSRLGAPARLVEVKGDMATVAPIWHGHKYDIRQPLTNLVFKETKNIGFVPKPLPPKEPVRMNPAPVIARPTAPANPPAPAQQTRALQDALDETDPDMLDLPNAIRRAKSDLEAARKMVDDAQAQEKECVLRLVRLRGKAQKLLDMTA